MKVEIKEMVKKGKKSDKRERKMKVEKESRQNNSYQNGFNSPIFFILSATFF